MDLFRKLFNFSQDRISSGICDFLFTFVYCEINGYNPIKYIKVAGYIPLPSTIIVILYNLQIPIHHGLQNIYCATFHLR